MADSQEAKDSFVHNTVRDRVEAVDRVAREQLIRDAEQNWIKQGPAASGLIEMGAGEAGEPTAIYPYPVPRAADPAECCPNPCVECEGPGHPVTEPPLVERDVTWAEIREAMMQPCMTVTAPRRDILQEAQEIIHGQRRQDYGGPSQSFARIAALWNAYFEGDPAVRTEPCPHHCDCTWTVAPDDVAMLMLLLKVARFQGGGGQRDSLVDICGYAGCVELMHQENGEEL